MTNISKISYSSLEPRGLQQVIKDVKSACDKLHIPFFGIGALARNIWYLANNEAPRGTKDIDFALKTAQENFKKLKMLLTTEFSYTEHQQNPNCLISSNGLEVDLLPFSESMPDKMPDFDGLSEVFETEIREVEIEGDKFKICSSPALVLLKLIAFDDRPEHRQKDADDINSILRDYHKIEIEMIYEKYSYLFEEDKSMEVIGIEALGHEVGKIIQNSPKLYQRVLNILEQAIANPNYRLTSLMIEDAEKETREGKIKYLKTLKTNITQVLSNPN